MEREARRAVRKEFVMGTSPDDLIEAEGQPGGGSIAREASSAATRTGHTVAGAGAVSDSEEAPVLALAPPAIADVAAVVSTLAASVLVAPSTPGDFRLRPVAADELDHIADICELLEQVESWAVEESSGFITEPSQLAAVEAPHVVAACLASERPRVLAGVLRVVDQLLHHPQSRAELLREVAEAQPGAGTALPVAERETLAVAALTQLLTNNLARHGGVVAVVLPALSVATTLAPMDGAAEVALREGTVGEAMRVAQTLAHHVSVSAAVAAYIAAIVRVPFCRVAAEACGASAEAASTMVPTAVIVTHVGAVLPTLVMLARRDTANLAVKRAVCRALLDCARHVENRERVVQVGAYTVLAESFRHAVHVPDLFATCAEALGYCIPALDALQTRQLTRTLRDVLLLTGDIEQQALVLALLVVLARFAVGTKASAATARAFAAYQLYPLPPCATVEAHVADAAGTAPPEPLTLVRLRTSPVFFAPDDKAADVLATLRALRVPQLVGHIIDFYATHDGSDVDAEEADKVRRVRRLAEQCLDCLSQPLACGGHG